MRPGQGEEGMLSVATGQGRGRGRHSGEGQGGRVAGQDGQALAVLPDRSVVTYQHQGDGNLVSVILRCICYYSLSFSLIVLKIQSTLPVKKFSGEA